jgi:hypothetical protein
MKAIPVLIPSILPPSMADGAVPIPPLAQAGVDVVLVGVDLRARSYRFPKSVVYLASTI